MPPQLRQTRTTLLALVIAFLLMICGGVGVISIINDQERVLVSVTQPTKSATINFQEQNIQVEIADTPELRTVGLSGRNYLPADSGMLFIFPNPIMQTFWMKDTFISLDIIFLDRELRVVDIFKNTKPNQTTELYTPRTSASFVLEVNGGWSERANLEIGDQLFLDKNF